ncbi:6363_t:CDS:2 [Paraglomus occultum]|uniref:6363_t:CDS:1 n=1 Tax=Paraglomus occultum TaxID=144539 RepID=A0A9N9AJF2_9GLOM|nr:6363_t:CDS:2 [Paraglomus occultum]
MTRWRITLSNIPQTVKSLALLNVFISALGGIIRVHRWSSDSEYPESDPYLNGIAIIPGAATWNFWTFVTAGFLETNLTSVSGFREGSQRDVDKELALNKTSTTTMLAAGKYFGRVWGSKELLKFVAIVIIGANLASFVTYLVEYYVTGDIAYLYATQINGQIGLIEGFLVSYKQLIPEHLFKVFSGTVSMRVKHFPSIFIITSLIFFILFEAQSQFLLVIYGWLISWTYIRFFKVQDGIRGDRSETFSLASFFPEMLQPPVKVISSIIFNFLVILRCCKPIQRKRLGHDLGGYNPRLAPAMPGSARAEAERRRALALKALDKRLQATSNKFPRTSRFDSSSNLPSSPPPPPLLVNTSPLVTVPRPGEVSSPVLFDTNQNDGSTNATGNAGRDGNR